MRTRPIKAKLRTCSLASALWVLLSLSVARAATTVTITVDTRTVFQTMHGFGSSERVFDDPHVFNNFNQATGRTATVLTTAQQDVILNLLYSQLGLTRVRPATDAGIETINDNPDPDKTDLSKFDFSWKRNDAHIDYVKKAMARGVTTYFLSPIVLEPWMTDTNPREYVEWAMAILRRWREFGLKMPYYSVINEPGHPRSGLWSGQYILDVIKLMGPKLRAEGFKTKFVITDDLNASEAYKRCQIILADAQARRYVGALAFHLYDEPLSRVAQMKELAEHYRLPLWMTEYFQSDPFGWANTMHELIANYNVSAVDYMWGFFGEWSHAAWPGNELISLVNSGSRYVGHTLTKHYYVMGQFSQYVRPGFRRVKTDSTDDAVKVTAYADGGNLVLVVINSSSAEKTVQFRLNGIASLTRMTATRTSATQNWNRLADQVVRESGFVATVPGRSVTTFQGFKS